MKALLTDLLIDMLVKPVHFIAIVGPRFSGKTTFARELQNRVLRRLPVIGCDKYKGDLKLLTSHIAGWQQGQPQGVPEYYVRGKASGVITRSPAPVMILDGVDDQEILAKCTITLFIACANDQRLARFIEKALTNVPSGRHQDAVMKAMRDYFSSESEFLRRIGQLPETTAWMFDPTPPRSLVRAIDQMSE